MKTTNIEFNVNEFLMKKLWEIIDKQKFEKYCTTIVIIYVSVPTTFMSFVLSDMFWDIIVAKI